jgi:hypothetical protein
MLFWGAGQSFAEQHRTKEAITCFQSLLDMVQRNLQSQSIATDKSTPQMLQRSQQKAAQLAAEIPKTMVLEATLVTARLWRPFNYAKTISLYRQALVYYFPAETLQQVSITLCKFHYMLVIVACFLHFCLPSVDLPCWYTACY